MKKEKAFAIMGLVKGRSWNFICGENALYYISYDGFKLENHLFRLRGQYPKNKYKIVEVEIAEA